MPSYNKLYKYHTIYGYHAEVRSFSAKNRDMTHKSISYALREFRAFADYKSQNK